MDFFTPSTGVYDKTNRECFKVYDCLGMLIRFMSDDTMTFDSVTFGTGGEFEDYWLLTGYSLRTTLSRPGFDVPVISFGDLFRELDKRFNIAFYLDFSGAKPKMWIEAESLVYTTGIQTTLTNVKDIEKSVRMDRMYAKIKIGNQTYQESESGTFSWPDVTFFNHWEEEFHLLGDNNTDAELDLSCEYISGHNIIEDVLVNSVNDYDEDIFLVEADAGTGQAVQYDLFNLGAGPYSYNRKITNSEIAPRHLKGISNSLALYLGNGNDGFEATRTANTTSAFDFAFTLWDYDNEVSDPNNNYDNTATNYKYTVPTTGFYRFQVDTNLRLGSVAISADWDLDIEVRRYDSFSVLVETRAVTLNFVSDGNLGANVFSNSDPNNCVVTKGNALLGSPVPFTIIWQPLGYYADATDYFQVYIKATTNAGSVVWYLDGGRYQTTENENGGGTYQVSDPNEARVIEYLFTAPMSLSQYRLLQADPKDLIAFTGNPSGETNYGWIEQITYKPEKGIAEIQLITSINDET
jgi:hypothetical protein